MKGTKSFAERKLLIINFVTDMDDPVLGFAVDWISELSEHADRVTVLTGRLGRANLPKNVAVVSTHWKTGQDLRNTFRFYQGLFKVLSSHRPQVAFTHMAASQGMLAAPLLYASRKRHVLWYTHFKPTRTLKVLLRMVNLVVTADEQTFPIETPKRVAIGHGIKALAQIKNQTSETELDFVHWGRCDPSKNLDYLAEVIAQLNQDTGCSKTLRILGVPSKVAERTWEHTLLVDQRRPSPVIHWEGPVSHNRLSDFLTSNLVFIHASTSGLDKSPLEAVLLGIPVLSENLAVSRALGNPSPPASLANQIREFLGLSEPERDAFAARQFEIIKANHSLETIGARLVPALFPDPTK